MTLLSFIGKIVNENFQGFWLLMNGDTGVVEEASLKINPFCKFWKVNKQLIGKIMNLIQLTFTCSNSTIETLEKDVKYVQSWQ